MPYDIDVKDIIVSDPTAIKDTNIQALAAARAGICSIYQASPGRFAPQSSFVPGANQVAQAMVSALCPDVSPNKPRAKPFTGGQCDCTSYTYDIRFSDTGATVITGTNGGTGPIGGVIYKPNASNPENTDAYVSSGVCTGGVLTGRVEQYKGTFGAGGFFSISGVRKTAGGADTCGDPFPVYPFERQPAITIPTNVNINTQVEVRPVVVLAPVVIVPIVSLKPNFNLSIPIKVGDVNFSYSGNRITQVVDFVDNSVAINSNISSAITSINTNTNNSINASITNINANTNSTSSSAITTLNNARSLALTNTSTSINSNTNSNVSSAITSINTNTSNVSSSAITSINNSTSTIINNLSASITASFTGLQTYLNNQFSLLMSALASLRLDLTAVLNLATKIDAKPECPPPVIPPDGTSPPPPDKPPDSSGSGTKPKVTYLEIILTKTPSKAQFGGDTGETVFFAGWIAFKYKSGGFSERQQINFRRSLFVAPSGSIGYTYTLTNGAKGYALVYSV